MPETLTIPERILKLIPPRPPEYYDVGELFPKRSGANLDPLAAAEALTNYELAFLFNPQRANRLITFHAQGNIGLEYVLDRLIDRTWNAPINPGLQGQIQLQTQQCVLSWLLNLNASENANHTVKAICHDRLQILKTLMQSKLKEGTSNAPHYEYGIERINKPKDFTMPVAKDIPPGAPIGDD